MIDVTILSKYIISNKYRDIIITQATYISDNKGGIILKHYLNNETRWSRIDSGYKFDSYILPKLQFVDHLEMRVREVNLLASISS